MHSEPEAQPPLPDPPCTHTAPAGRPLSGFCFDFFGGAGAGAGATTVFGLAGPASGAATVTFTLTTTEGGGAAAAEAVGFVMS